MSNLRLPAQLDSIGSPKSASVVGTVTAEGDRLSVQLTRAQRQPIEAVGRPVAAPYTAAPSISHWYLDREGFTALLAFVLVAGLFVALGWWV